MKPTACRRRSNRASRPPCAFLVAAILSSNIAMLMFVQRAGASCTGDVNNDNTVNVTDLLAVIGAWGPCGNPNDCPPDINNDDSVDVTDLLAVIGAWGVCPCSPVGTWVNASPVTYTCAFGIININITQWTFANIGGNLRVTAGSQIPAMNGLMVSCQTGSVFSVTGTLPGTCTETYTLTGTFSSPSQFSGTFTMNYTPTSGSCFDCMTHQVNVLATRP